MTAVLGFFLFHETLPITGLIGILLIILGIILISRSRKIATLNLRKDALFLRSLLHYLPQVILYLMVMDPVWVKHLLLIFCGSSF